MPAPDPQRLADLLLQFLKTADELLQIREQVRISVAELKRERELRLLAQHDAQIVIRRLLVVEQQFNVMLKREQENAATTTKE